jgi:hypothetical protein
MKTLAAMALAGLLVAGCGSDDDKSSTGGTSTPATCDGVANALCSKLQACFPVAVDAAYGGDLARCALGPKLSCEKGTGAPGSNTTAATLAGCADKLLTLGCADLQATLDGKRAPICETVPGQVAAGGSCYTSEQCKSTLCNPAVPCGTCADAPEIGQPCETFCARDAYCDFTSHVCMKLGNAGDPCPMGYECNTGLLCSAGKCIADTPKTAALGDPCTQSDDCNPIAGEVCHPTKMVCAKVEFVGPGESCGLIGDRLVGCRAGGKCSAGKCVAPAADNAACDPQMGIDCLEPAECMEGFCRLETINACK